MKNRMLADPSTEPWAPFDSGETVGDIISERIGYHFAGEHPGEMDDVYRYRNPNVLGEPESDDEDGYLDEQSQPGDKSDKEIHANKWQGLQN